MFTGIVQALGRVRSFEDGRLVVERGPVDAAIGDSVAVNGVCLTVVERGEETLAFDVVPETVSRTRPFGDAVNLEPPLRAGDPFGGHVVQGHVDGVGRVRDVDDEGIWVDPPDGAAPLRRREGLDRRRRRLAHDRGARRRRLPDRADPAYARGDDARRARAGRRRQPRGRRAGQVRRAARANPLSTMSRVTTETRVFAPIEDAIEDIRQGKFVVVVDDEDRENEGDLTIAAQFATPEAVNFMATHGRGLICLCLTEERCDELGLPPMAEHNEAPLGTAFTVTIEAREGVTTGISAHDRSRTIQVAIDPSKGAHDLVRPGHVFPLRAKRGGVLERIGQTEAAVDLARLAGLQPAGVVCEIMNPDGTMARVPDLVPYCREHGIRLISVADLVEYRRRHEKLVERVVATRLPTMHGEFTAVAFRERLTGKHHVALVRGEVEGAENVLVRVHSECLTGDVFHSLRCDCGEQLETAMARIAAEERGVLLYMAQEGRGIGLLEKLKAYELQEQGLDTVEANLALGFPADARDYGIGNQILADLGLTTIRVLTNNPRKLTGIEGFGLTVVEQVPLEIEPNAENVRYLAAKRAKLGHRLHHQDLKDLTFEAEEDEA